MERENELLTKQLQELSDELESSKAYINNLLQRKGRDNEWEKKEKEYKEAITNLKAQVRSGEAMVSLGLYRKAVDEARARAIECQDKRLEISTMTRKVQALEKRLKGNKPKRLSPPDAQPALVNLRKVSPTSSVKADENGNTPKTPRVGKSSRDVRPPPPPPTPRMTALRKEGGRAGLCAKLKQMRRSPLVNKN